jgi:hypothetical protein
MMITLFRKEADGRLRYYNIHDQQPHLIPEWVFTVSYTSGNSWSERIHRFDSPQEMDLAIRKLVRRKFHEGFALLYSFGEKRGRRRRPGEDYATELEKLAK